jgi:replicative DNA helicase
MSISDEVRPPDNEPAYQESPRTADGPPRAPRQSAGPGTEFERTPPQDIAAEQCVLGGMLLSKDAIADVVEILRTNDFYQPKHGVIFDAILDLYSRGEPADSVTVTSRLVDAGEITRIGGVGYLHTLVSSVPTAANAAYYARIVADRAILRRLIEAGTRISQLGYGAGAGAGRDIDDLVDLAQQTVYDVTERRASEDFAALNELLQPTLDEIEAIGANGGVMTGIPTGFTDLDRLLNGLHPGQLIVVAGRPGLGKALALDTPLPTPDGWTTMGEVQVGDQLIGADGGPTRVVAATDVMHGRPCYEIEFSDGTVIVADALHQWVTWDSNTRKAYDHADPNGDPYPKNWACWSPSGPSNNPCPPGVRDQMREWRAAGPASAQIGEKIGRSASAVRQQWNRPEPVVKAVKPCTTVEIANTLRLRGQRNHAIPASRALALPAVGLPIDPYVLGYLLGDGDTSGSGRVACTPEDREWLIEEFAAAGYQAKPYDDQVHLYVSGVRAVWRSLGLPDGKRVPAAYLRGSYAQRLALVQGLIDSDGYVDNHGAYRFTNTCKALVDGFRELVSSLGCVPQVKPRKGRIRAGRVGADSWEIIVPTNLPLARIPRKALAARQVWEREQFSRFIVDVRPVGSVPVRCVQVDSADHMYLASESWIPTHNSTVAMDFARSCSIKNNMASVFFSLEMSKVETVMRLLSAEARVPLHTLRSGQLSDDDWTKLARRMGEISEAPLFCDDTPNMTLMEIRAKARRLKQRHDVKLIVVDYLQLMTSPRRIESRQQEVAELSRGLKLLAKEVDCPVIAVSQLNRGPEQRTDKRPQLSDLRESGCLTAGTRILRADTGTETTLGELVASGATDVPVWSADEKLRYGARTLTHAFPSGVKDAFLLRLASGRQIEATGNHPFLTLDGWRALERLAPGDRLAIPRHVPAPLVTKEWPESEIVMLAHLIGDGSFVKRQSIRYAAKDEENVTAVTVAAEHFGITAVRDDYAAARCTTVRLPAPYRLARGRRNPVAEWLDGLGIFGLRSHEKFVPDGIFGLPKRQVALFLRHLWATDGCVWWDERNQQARIYYASASRRLVDGLTVLLLRFGIMSHIKTVHKSGYRDGYHAVISGGDDQLRFLREIGVHGQRSAQVVRCLAGIERQRRNTNRDTVPREVWDRVRTTLSERRMTHRELAPAMETQVCGSTIAPGRARLARVAEILEDADLEMLATNDIHWDEIRSVEPLGPQPVYDATVLGTHNFIANGVSTHNSIEQDADVVLLLHREDYYDKESPRAGEADFIVAKHRNGPTDTITVAAQLHLSRFVDMAVG